ncbi:TKL family protein kinase [Histomonas meleagridis]|uniref:TKL family protein kinase n=1 Tax=Histomonas meleagridis TaxID=135588 RepID=UPI00355942E3|nr:TKL family protein kinase [Histomonas meleagridis]KAH0806243.1 TKL family protein kinase [Histomonas meleagridis]
MGYTDTYPYCIVTQYVEQGSLYDALKHKPNSPTLDSTDKTKIAMCIAHGMSFLHSMKIIHRDLKSLNILLDSNCLPKVIDFGISRFHNEQNELVTSTIGTPHWMAPEMFNSSHYDVKVDVYAFGIMLWEMLTEETPFEGMSAYQIMTAVCQNQKRPAIPSDAPEGLSNLIDACWEQSPTKRPTFFDVFQEFATQNAYFPGTNLSEIATFVKTIQTLDKEKKTVDKLTSDESSSQKSSSSKRRHSSKERRPSKERHSTSKEKRPVKERRSTSKRSKDHHPFDLDVSEKQEKYQPPQFNFIAPASSHDNIYKKNHISLDVLMNPLSPTYLAGLKAIVSRISAQQAPEFFERIVSNLQHKLSEQVISLIFHNLSKLLRDNSLFVPHFISNNLFRFMKCTSSIFVDSYLRILVSISKVMPGSIPLDIINDLMRYVPNNEKKFICLLSSFHHTCVNNPNFRKIVEIYTINSNPFLLSEYSALYLNVLYHIAKNGIDYSFVTDVFMKAFQCNHADAIQIAYQSLCILPFDYSKLPLGIIVGQLNTYPKEATSIIARMPTIPNSKRLLAGLIKAARTEPLALCLICKLTDSPKGCMIIIENNDWLKPKNLNTNSQLKIFLSVFSHPEMRFKLLQMTHLIGMFKKVIEDCPLESVQAIVTAIRRISANNLEFIERLSESGFLYEFIQTVFVQPNQELAKCGLLLFDNLGRHLYLSDYLDIIPYFPTLLKMDIQVQISALCAMIVLTIHKQTLQVFVQNNLPQMVEKMKLPSKFEQYKRDFLERFKDM